jgi:hypothetical protein
MFPLTPYWSALPSGPPLAPMVVLGFPLLLVAIVAIIACAAIVGIDVARNRAARAPKRNDTHLIEIRDPSRGSRAAAGVRQ